MDIVFYDRNGKPCAYSEDGTHIYLYSGKPVAHIEENSIFSYLGKHLGWLEDGWVRDNDGFCVFFTDNCSGGPSKPFKKSKPFKGFKSFRPFKGFKNFKPFRRSKKNSWSDIDAKDFFVE